jgi:hypothetical protein
LTWLRTPEADGCISAEALRRDVERRLGYDPFDDAATKTVAGIADRVDGRWRARLFARRGDHVLGERTLSADARSCDSLSASVGLALALIVDPRVALGPVGAATPGTGVAETTAGTEREGGAGSGATDRPSANGDGPGNERSSSAVTRQAPKAGAPARSAPPNIVAPVPEELPTGGAKPERETDAGLPKPRHRQTSGRTGAPRTDARPAALELTAGIEHGTVPGAAVPIVAGHVTVPFGRRGRIELGAVGLPERQRASIGFGRVGALARLCVDVPTPGWIDLGLCGRAELAVEQIYVQASDSLVPLDPGPSFFALVGADARVAVTLVGPLRAILRAGAAVPLPRPVFRLRGEEAAVFAGAWVAPRATVGLGVDFP